MLSLIIKDILVQKKTILFSMIYVVFALFVFQQLGPAVFSIAIVAVTYMLIITACAYEDKNKSDIMVNSLPIKRSDVVLAKYLSVYLYMAAGTVAYIVFTGIISITGIPLETYPPTWEGFIGAAISVTLINGVYFPIFFKYGYIKSKVVNFVLFFAFFFGVTSLVNILKQNKDSELVKGIIEFFSGKPEYINIITVAAVIMALIYISYTLSVKFYKNREF